MNETISGQFRLKEASGWFAAGTSFKKALTLLSDGAFKLFAHICLEANRQTGRLTATQKELARALNKSKRAIGTYVAELETNGICTVKPGKNQFAGTIFEITDRYWPYDRPGNGPESLEQNTYVHSVRECFLALDCTIGKFGAAEAATALKFQQRGIPWAVLEQAMLLGACRKYTSWIQGQALDPIQGLSYFEPLITEVREKPLSLGYSAYLRKKVIDLTEAWNESRKSGNGVQKGRYPDMPS